MKNRKIRRNNAGTTLLELMIAAGIMTSSLVLLIGSSLNISALNDVTDQEVAAVNFNRSMIENMRGLSLDGILGYQVPFDDPDLRTVGVPGLGNANVTIWAVLPANAYGAQQAVADPQATNPVPPEYRIWFMCGMDDPTLIVNAPNPIEIQIEVSKVTSSPYGEEGGTPNPTEGYGFHYQTSTILAY